VKKILFTGGGSAGHVSVNVALIPEFKKNGYEVGLDKGEIFVYSLLGKDQFECLVSDGKHFKPGSEIVIDEKVSFLSLAFTENGIAFQIKGMDLLDFLEKYGEAILMYERMPDLYSAAMGNRMYTAKFKDKEVMDEFIKFVHETV